jgi:hypothetical protein
VAGDQEDNKKEDENSKDPGPDIGSFAEGQVMLNVGQSAFFSQDGNNLVDDGEAAIQKDNLVGEPLVMLEVGLRFVG